MNSESLTNYEFFKIILEKVLPNKLELPKKFVKVKGSTVPSSVTLETRCGSLWEVTVLKREGRMWLHGSGWLEFAAHFSVTFGYLLFFQYRPNLTFKVSICDGTTCQINYPIKQSQELDEDEDEVSSPYSEGKNHGSGSQSHNRLFNMTVHASMVHSRYCFQLPTKFWKNHLHGKTSSVILQDSVGNRWPVEICIRERDRPRPFFNANDWAAFACANNLVVGDVCRFELIDMATFEVSISRGAQISDSDTESSHERVIELDSDDISSSSSQRSIERAMKNIANSKASVSGDDLGSKECRQRPKTVSNNDLSSKKPRGMPKKNIANSKASASDDDVGSKQHSQRLNKKIAKSKASVSDNYLGSKQRCPRLYRDSKVFLEATKFKSQNPFFSAVVAKGPNYHLRVPLRFAKSCFKEKSEMVTLQTGIKSWLVKLVFCQCGYYLSRGFSKFVAENSLRSRDVCVYELIKRDSVFLRVHIFRNKGY